MSSSCEEQEEKKVHASMKWNYQWNPNKNEFEKVRVTNDEDIGGRMIAPSLLTMSSTTSTDDDSNTAEERTDENSRLNVNDDDYVAADEGEHPPPPPPPSVNTQTKVKEEVVAPPAPPPVAAAVAPPIVAPDAAASTGGLINLCNDSSDDDEDSDYYEAADEGEHPSPHHPPSVITQTKVKVEVVAPPALPPVAAAADPPVDTPAAASDDEDSDDDYDPLTRKDSKEYEQQLAKLDKLKNGLQLPPRGGGILRGDKQLKLAIHANNITDDTRSVLALLHDTFASLGNTLTECIALRNENARLRRKVDELENQTNHNGDGDLNDDSDLDYPNQPMLGDDTRLPTGGDQHHNNNYQQDEVEGDDEDEDEDELIIVAPAPVDPVTAIQDAMQKVVHTENNLSTSLVEIMTIPLVRLIVGQIKCAYNPLSPNLPALSLVAKDLVAILQNLSEYKKMKDRRGRKKNKGVDINLSGQSLTIAVFCRRLEESAAGDEEEVPADILESLSLLESR